MNFLGPKIDVINRGTKHSFVGVKEKKDHLIITHSDCVTVYDVSKSLCYLEIYFYGQSNSCKRLFKMCVDRMGKPLRGLTDMLIIETPTDLKV